MIGRRRGPVAGTARVAAAAGCRPRRTCRERAASCEPRALRGEGILGDRSTREYGRVPPFVVLVIMMSITVLNVMDRQLLAVLIEPIKRDLGVSDGAMGLLTGTSFALLHVLASFPVAIWADRSERRSIIALGLALWSGLTVATGFARSYLEMFVIRIGVGIGETTGGPPAQSFLSDAFPPHRRATALSALLMGGPLGSMVAFALGGWLGETVGWRMAFVIFGVPGLVLAVLVRGLLVEPRRGAFDAPEPPAAPAPALGAPAAGPTASASAVEPPPLSPWASLRALVRVPSMRALMVGAWLNTIGIYAVLVWAVPYLGRVHGLSTSDAGARLAIASGLFTALGTWASGPLADRLGQRDPVWLARLPALACAGVLPFGLAFAFAPSGDVASLLLAPASFLSGTYFGPVYGAVQTLSPSRSRALAATCITAGNTILGLGVAPPVVGFLNDLFASAHGASAIRYSIALMMTMHLAAAVVFLVAQATIRQDLEARQRSAKEGS